MDRRSHRSTPGESSPELQDTPLEELVEQFLTAKAKGRTNDTGSYRRNLERDVVSFLEYLVEETRSSPARFCELDPRHCRQ